MVPIAIPAGAALLQGLGSFLGSRSQADAAKEAAQAQAEAALAALDFQRGVYNQTTQQYQPYIEAGGRGLQGYESAIAGFTQPGLQYKQADFNQQNWKDPGYDYRLNEAAKAINASTAAKGMTLGSGALKELQTRSQDMASQEYQNAYDRFLKDSAMRYGQASDQYTRDYTYGTDKVKNWQNLANIGAGAIGNLGSIGSGAGAQIGQTMQNIGDAYAGSALAQGNANAAGWNTLGTGLGNLANQLGQYYYSGNK